MVTGKRACECGPHVSRRLELDRRKLERRVVMSTGGSSTAPSCQCRWSPAEPATESCDVSRVLYCIVLYCTILLLFVSGLPCYGVL